MRKRIYKNHFSHLVLAFAAALILSGAVSAQTTEFNYQGSLKDNAAPATGNYDFEFALYDAVSGGAQLGSTLTRNSVAVANGVFSVKLDFLSQFPGANRFLEIRVRTAGGGTFTPLTPRQPVNSAPYSVKSLNAATATNATQLGGVAANQFVQTNDLRLTDDRNPLPNSTSYIQNGATLQTASQNISGNAYFGGKVGIGTTTPFAKLQVNAGDFEGVNVSSNNGNGVYSVSGGGIGVFGSSISNNGVFGMSINSVGVEGLGGNSGSIALKTSGTSWFQGDTTPLQNTTGTGILIGTSPSLGYVQAFNYASGAKILVLNNSGGNVAIGGSNALRTLHVNGRVRIDSAPTEPGTLFPTCFNNQGDVVLCGGSSLRWKTNIQPFLGGLDIVRELRPISFDWKNGSGHDIGLGAEDVAKIAPSLARVNSNGEVEAVKYEKLNLLLINAIKEQQTQIEQQQKQIAALLSANAAMSTRLRSVEKRLRKQARRRVSKSAKPTAYL